MIESSNIAEQFVISMYLQACQLAQDQKYSQESHQQSIIESLKQCKIPFKYIRKLVAYSKQDWIQDLLEVTQDLKTVLAKNSKNFIRFINRSRMHFGGEHCQNLAKSEHHKPTKKVLEMYRKGNFEWNDNTEEYFMGTIFPNCTYMMGLTKGNGVIINTTTHVSCAHVFCEEDAQQLFQIRCFSNGHGQYGLIKTTKFDVFEQEDVVFGEIIYFSGEKIKQISLQSPSELQFRDFTPFKCIQLGVLFDPDEFVEPFYTSQGFIERNLYENQNDTLLLDEMGLLVHGCYGLWGTSGSPIWSSRGEFIGIHNAWNDQGRNVSMIVHDSNEEDEDNVFSEKDQCRVVKQYERRAISTHVIRILREKWLNNKGKTIKKVDKQRAKGRKSCIDSL